MATEAQKEAQKKYRATKVKTITLEFYPNKDQELLDKLNEVESKQGYIKNLIREDIKKVTR